MGCPDSVLPELLLKKHSVICLLSNKDKEPYKDHLVLFRALAMYINGHNDLESHISRHLTEFIKIQVMILKDFAEFLRRQNLGR